ncbi:Serine_threonine-protein kinase PknD [Nocardiopsis dassonvillei]|uniref:serine/threonine-protein kinase n=1 Tax=Nocardiopsis dassonvillei TaxID=2014 RepID=UPI003F54845F
MPHAESPPFARGLLPEGVRPITDREPSRIGPYDIVGRIGAGGMGAVYAGVSAEAGHAAVKVVHPHYAADPDFRARFAREVAMVARVRASCTAAFLGADTAAESPWMATEYVPGDTLRAYVRKNGPLTGGLGISLAAGLAEALTGIHAEGVVHRDLKPGNVILSPSGPKVLDFGIARAADGTALTRTGGLFGTPGWMAPEQYGGVPASEFSDMFAWGCLVAFGTTGRDPFAGGPLDVVVHRTRTAEPDLTGMPPELVPTVRRALAKNPQDRPTAAQALAEVTAAWSATRVQQPALPDPDRAVPTMLAVEWRGVSAPAPRRVRRRPRAALLVPAVSAVLVTALLGVWLTFLRPDGGEPQADPAPQESASTATAAQDPSEAIGEAVRLAMEAPSFLTYSRFHTNDVGDPASADYAYTRNPEPRYMEVRYYGALMSGHMEVGPDAERVIPLRQGGADGMSSDMLTVDPAGAPQLQGPRSGWEAEMNGILERTGREGATAEYAGLTPVPTEFVPEDIAAERDMASLRGHRYSGTFPPDPPTSDEQPVGEDVVFDLWIGEDGYPLRYRTTQDFPDWGPTDTGEPFRVHTFEIIFVHFGEPVDLPVPEEGTDVPAVSY